MILKYYIEVSERVDDDINFMDVENTSKMIQKVEENITNMLKSNGFKPIIPIKLGFDLESGE